MKAGKWFHRARFVIVSPDARARPCARIRQKFYLTPCAKNGARSVFPALALNYLGQGALLLTHPDALENPYFKLYPAWALLPMIALAILATIIASQAVITGAYSVTQQAMSLCQGIASDALGMSSLDE